MRGRRRPAAGTALSSALAFSGGFWLTVAFALLAGVGTGTLPPGRAGRPAEPRLGGASPGGHIALRRPCRRGVHAGPALAAVGLIVAGPETVMRGERPDVRSCRRRSWLASRLGRPRPRTAVKSAARWPRRRARESARSRRMPGVRAIIIGSSAVLLFAGLFNVGELLLAEEELGAGASGFALLVAVFGVGVAAGSLGGASSGTLAQIKRRYLIGLGVTGVGFFAAGLAPGFAVAALRSPWRASATAWCSFTSGCSSAHGPEPLMGRVFGVEERSMPGVGRRIRGRGRPLRRWSAPVGASRGRRGRRRVALLPRGSCAASGPRSRSTASPLPELVERLERPEPAVAATT